MSEERSTILVVDADTAVTSAALAALPAGLHRVRTAADAQGALAALVSQKVDVLVSELLLPDASGLHLLAEARRLHPRVARIALTAAEDLDTVLAAVNEAEVFRFLRKPVDPFALRRAVEEALERAQASSAFRGAHDAAERRRIALVDLEIDHPGISLVPAGPEGLFLSRHRLEGLARRLGGTPVGTALAQAIAGRPKGEPG